MTTFRKTVLQAGLSVGLLLAGTVLPAVAGQSVSSARQGLPGRRVSGGTRSECMANSPLPIVALSPESNLGKTISDRPSLYFVVPALEQDYPLAFSLRDPDGNRVYEKSLSSRENQGVMEIQLPAESLRASQNYRWYLSVVCEAQDSSQNDVLSGWLRQVEPEVAAATITENRQAIVADNAVERGLAIANNYQEAGLWSDAIDTLVSLREQHPNDADVRQSWQHMLQALSIENAVEPSVAMR